MVNRSKNIGTRGESGVVNFAKGFGFPWADRQPLRGNKDTGDVLFCPGFIGEVKAGRAAWEASDNQVAAWLAETEREQDHAGADIGLLIVARYRQPVERWWGVMTIETMADLTDSNHCPSAPGVWVRMQLVQALRLARFSGYGDALPTIEDELAS